LIVCNIGTIVAFIWVGSCQHFDIKDSIARADSSLALTRRSNESFERFPKIGLQAYVVLDETPITSHLVCGERITISPDCKNVGKTPAFNFFHVNVCAPVDGGILDLAEYESHEESFRTADRHRNERNALGTDIRNTKEGFYGIYSWDDSVKSLKALKNSSLWEPLDMMILPRLIIVHGTVSSWIRLGAG
jgi:hypothetical protein